MRQGLAQGAPDEGGGLDPDELGAGRRSRAPVSTAVASRNEESPALVDIPVNTPGSRAELGLPHKVGALGVLYVGAVIEGAMHSTPPH